ncbi:unnamed protein product [Haemonchus placei]|uniref:GLOBIN domain-containing protein n=1 Tax=Haemonchus placei TaxID=6290 RepID=A0A158QME6_HAEPC|nr:unnamed protein product [Haemonchus placei]
MNMLEKINSEDKELLKRSWTFLEKNINNTAYCIFDMIFRQSPDTKQLFPFMKIRKPGDAKRSREMEFHGLRFMQVLQSVVKSIDNPTSLDPLCDNLGRVHGRLIDSRGFKAHHWSVFIECTLFHFREVLGSVRYFTAICCTINARFRRKSTVFLAPTEYFAKKIIKNEYLIPNNHESYFLH